ncbi:MAG TPA: branched-chain amino acid ABC transporter permease/ATP-binding protein [Mycobacteriales bacterium]|nr:branched-chain amino acid ABC transporter permease/ATP-binding protein [Mycobacteriales bacterium]
MTAYVSFLLLGLANGATYAALGLALVVTYRSSKVMNLAVSAIALFAATIYAGLRSGQVPLLLPGLPETWNIGGELGFLPAALLALAVTAALGLILYLLVFRPLRSAPGVATAVASLGISVVLTSLIALRSGTAPPPVPEVFPSGLIHIGGVSVPKDRVWFALTVIAIALVVGAIWKHTRFGLISRAVSQNEKGAFVSGIPADRVAAASWMISTMVAGLAGILMAPIVAPVPINYALFLVPALAVATLGGFESIWAAVAGGLAVGMIQSVLNYAQAKHTWLPSSGLAEFVPLALLLIVLVVRAKPLPSRGMYEARRLGHAPRAYHLLPTAAAATVVAAVGLGLLHHQWRAALLVTVIFALISLSQMVVTGLSGQISLVQLPLAGVAAFLTAELSAYWTMPWGGHLPFPLTTLVAALGATVVGVVFALPAVRIRGLAVAVLTLALGVELEALWFRNYDIVGASGKNVDGPSLFGWDLSVGGGAGYPRLGFCLMTLAVLVAAAIAVVKLRSSSLGAAMLAVRANEKAASAAGVHVVRTKIIAFALAAFIAGLGGSLLAYQQGNVTDDSFSAYLGLSVFATAYLGGITSVSGAMVAGVLAESGIFVTFFDKYLSFLSLGDWYAVLAGIGLIVTVVKNPEGIVGPAHRWLAARRLSHQGTGTTRADVPRPAVPARPTPSGATPLSVREVEVHYGGVAAVSKVGFDVPAGSITGLIGPNGAGKTTLLDAISGFVGCRGQILLAGTEIGQLPAHVRAERGLGRTFQSIELYDDLTVAENVAVGQAAAGHHDHDSARQALARTLGILGLTEQADRPASELSQGTRQLVSIARAVAGEPAVLLLDEPAAGLDSTESRWLGGRLRDLRDTGMAILLVDHDLELVLTLCDTVQVLDFGQLIASGTPAETRADPRVRAAYIGTERHQRPPTPTPRPVRVASQPDGSPA